MDLFSSTKPGFDSLDFIYQSSLSGTDLALSLINGVHFSFFSSYPNLHFIQRLLNISSHSLNIVVEGILALLKPTNQVVGDSSDKMDNSKMSTRIRLRAGLLEVGTFVQQVLLKHGSKELISGLGEERQVFFKKW